MGKRRLVDSRHDRLSRHQAPRKSNSTATEDEVRIGGSIPRDGGFQNSTRPSPAYWTTVFPSREKVTAWPPPRSASTSPELTSSSIVLAAGGRTYQIAASC